MTKMRLTYCNIKLTFLGECNVNELCISKLKITIFLIVRSYSCFIQAIEISTFLYKQMNMAKIHNRNLYDTASSHEIKLPCNYVTKKIDKSCDHIDDLTKECLITSNLSIVRIV